MLVLDASVALAAALPDEKAEALEDILRRVHAEGALAPAIWPLEVLNALLIAERRRRLSSSAVDRALTDILRLPVRIVSEPPQSMFSGTKKIARVHGLSSYDASYLDLAKRNDLPLATFDLELRRAAASMRIPTL